MLSTTHFPRRWPAYLSIIQRSVILLPRKIILPRKNLLILLYNTTSLLFPQLECNLRLTKHTLELPALCET